MATDTGVEDSRSRTRRRSRSPQPKHATEQRSQSANPTPNRGFSALFPLGAKEGWSQWCSNTSPTVLEDRVLSFIPHVQKSAAANPTKSSASSSQSSLPTSAESASETSNSLSPDSTPDPYGPRKWTSQLVPLSGKNRALNEFSITRPNEQHPRHNLVMLHGYGAGLGFFYKNFDHLSRRPGWRLYALDMLGMGNSSRPPFKIKAKDRDAKIREAEAWFVDALEEWRVRRGIEKMTLLGHSMGGYVVAAYALKYPGRVEKLLLVSPVGIPEDPWATKSELPDPMNATDAESADAVLRDSGIAALDAGAADIKPPEAAQDDPDKPFQKPPSKLLSHLWDANISPFAIIRIAGPLGPRLASGWTSRRFAHLPQQEAAALHDYSYGLFRQRGSGEYALAYLLAPGAFARDPLIRRIEKIGRQEGERGVPIVFMYGGDDWMDVKGGEAAVKKIKEENERVLKGMSEEERRRDGGDAKVVVVERAGHHLYLDNFEKFNQVMEEELADVERRRAL